MGRRRWFPAVAGSLLFHLLVLALVRLTPEAAPRTAPKQRPIAVGLIETPRRPAQHPQSGVRPGTPAQPGRVQRGGTPRPGARLGRTAPVVRPPPSADRDPTVHAPSQGLSLELDPEDLRSIGNANPPPIGMGGGGGGFGSAEPERGGAATAGLALWPYLERIEDRVGHMWIDRIEREAVTRDPTGRRYSSIDRRTLIAFGLDRSGAILRPTIVRSCGVPHLDEAALAAVREGGPFPNPPVQLFEGAPERRFLFSFTLLAAGGAQGPRLLIR